MYILLAFHRAMNQLYPMYPACHNLTGSFPCLRDQDSCRLPYLMDQWPKGFEKLNSKSHQNPLTDQKKGTRGWRWRDKLGFSIELGTHAYEACKIQWKWYWEAAGFVGKLIWRHGVTERCKKIWIEPTFQEINQWIDKSSGENPSCFQRVADLSYKKDGVKKRNMVPKTVPIDQ